MRCSFIGAGKVGVTLGRYLQTSTAVTLGGYYSRRYEAAQKAAEATASKAFETPEQLISESDVIFLTVPDASILQVYQEICQQDLSGKQIIHCSGSLNSGVFSDITARRAIGLSIHPLYAFSQPYGELESLSKAVITIEGNQKKDAHVFHFWEKVFQEKGNPVIFMESDVKTKYHCAAVFGSNLVLGLLRESVKLFKDCGFSEEEALLALKPLTMGNLEKAFSLGLSQALTGPVERGDVDTIRKHMEQLDEKELLLYKALSQQALHLAKDRNKDRDYREAEELLS